MTTCEWMLPDNKPCGDEVLEPINPNRRKLCPFHWRVALRMSGKKQ